MTRVLSCRVVVVDLQSDDTEVYRLGLFDPNRLSVVLVGNAGGVAQQCLTDGIDNGGVLMRSCESIIRGPSGCTAASK
jgi:hypothetical protein